jgi:DNA topoisomerase-1
VKQMLEGRRALKGIEVHRITFNEITKRAVQYAIEHPRDLDVPLIDAYLARRALDYLVGFTLSLCCGGSCRARAPRARAVRGALRLICEREAEIEALSPRVLDGRGELPHVARRAVPRTADAPRGQEARPVRPAGRARRCGPRRRWRRAPSRVASIEKKRVRRNPPPPFTTSTLQQEASRKLGSARRRR